MHLTSIAFLAILAPITALPSKALLLRSTNPTTQLIAMAPTSASCNNAPVAGECATAAQAVSPLIPSFAQYHISSAAEQAALLSWMESGDFKYNAHYFPTPVPGRGTRAMLSPTFVKEYAASIPAVVSQAATLTDPAAILALVQADQYSFGAAAWFLSTVCSPAVRSGLQTGTLTGWAAWVTGCAQTTVTPTRQAYWERAVTALGV